MAGVSLDLAPLVKLQEGFFDKKGLQAVGSFLLSEAQTAFRRGGWRGGTRWPMRGVPNVAGIVRDLERGGTTLKNRRMQRQPVLMDTGRLRGSISMRIDTERQSVEVGTNVPYARTHQRGGQSILPGASEAHPQIRKNLSTMLRKLSGDRKDELRKALGWLFNVDNFTVRVPKRPIVEPTPVIIRETVAILVKNRRFPGDEQ